MAEPSYSDGTDPELENPAEINTDPNGKLPEGVQALVPNQPSFRDFDDLAQRYNNWKYDRNILFKKVIDISAQSENFYDNRNKD
ncbi:uncharacterized protein N7529_010396 [Penicillium soppii]|uniref:uncharacterized protein n=1 Tax=Penicillium soppii TaxID=69789 RepID=UPI002548A4FC|nr:uncharacterized protein N7529_010396 [Penicillium soppii]KAJ5856452.1 hypothetical protein N7529_010396 [Penicillium soppii]